MKSLLNIKQSGAVLVTALIILVLMMIIALSSMQSTILQEKMTTAIKDGQIALESAESALRDAEHYLSQLSDTSAFTQDGASGLYLTGFAPSPFSKNQTPWNHARLGSSISGVEHVPKYYIELLGKMETPNPAGELAIGGYESAPLGGDLISFKIYARGQGKSNHSERVITSFFAREF